MITVIEDIKKYAYKNNKDDKNLISYLIFNHILITSINRVALQKNKDKKYVINQFIMYCKNNISDYKKQKFYQNIPRNRKIIANLNYHKMWNISKLLLKLKEKIK